MAGSAVAQSNGEGGATNARRGAPTRQGEAAIEVPADRADYRTQLPRVAPHEPKDALQTFQVLPGFHIQQVAAEPLVCSPVAMSFDENGRLFVVEMRDYSEQDKERLGTVRLLEDTDGDGTFDKSTVYADGLSWPTAIICYGGGVFVGAPPDVYFLKDTDGDGKADQRKTVFTGFGRGNVQGLMNSFTWGLDNRIHGATSSSGASVSDGGGRVHDLGGRDFSFDPQTLDLRPESGGAQHGLSFDDWGRKFVCSNSDHLQMVMFEDRYLERNPAVAAPPSRLSIAADGPQARVFRISPVEPWRVLRTRLRVEGVVPGPVEGGGQPAGYFTGATGATTYRGDAWPAEYRGQAFIGDVGSNLVHRKVLQADGVSFVARRVDEGKEFIACDDIWFRPVQFANAPDGTLYVLDMYREVIEHPASLPPEIKKHLDLTSGRERGRIYRIVPDGFKQRPLPTLGAMTTLELVALLEHRNGWHRDTAARLLYERQDPAARQPSEKLATSSPVPEGRMQAMYALAGSKTLSPEVLLYGLGDEHPRVREHSVRLCETLSPPTAEISAKLVELVGDPDPRVRYQLAFTLGSVDGLSRDEALARLLKADGQNPSTRFAARTSVRESPRVLARLIADRAWTKAEAAQSLIPWLAAQEARKGDADFDHWLVETLDAMDAESDALVEAILRELLHDGWGGRGNSLIDGKKRVSRVRDAMLAGAREAVTNGDLLLPRRVQAVGLVATDPSARSRETLRALLDPRQAQELQLAAVSGLDQWPDDDAAKELVTAWPKMSPRVRAAAAEVALARPGRAARFLDAVAAGLVKPSDVGVGRLKQLTGSEDARVRSRAAEILARLNVSRRDDVIAAYRGALALNGDAAKGRATFQKTCAACHRLEGVGHEIGPSLAAMQSRGAEAVLVNLLDPNREINPQFVEYVVETTDGRTVTGMLAAETANGVTLRRAEGVSDTVPRAAIKRMRAAGISIMPEGLEQQIDLQGMADLVTYVMRAK